MMLTIIIADDNSMELLYLRRFLENMEDVLVVGEAKDGHEAIKLTENLHPDVLMLDIEMPGVNGVEVAREIKKQYPNIYIIFTTAHPDYAVEAFEVNSTDYLVKPYQLDRLSKSIERIKKDIESKTVNFKNIIKNLDDSDTIYVKQGMDLVFIDTDSIIFIEKINRKTSVHTTSGTHETSLNLDELGEKLDKKNFFRSFKSCIINLKMVERITISGENSYDVYFKNTDKKAFMSRTKKELLNRILEGEIK